MSELITIRELIGNMRMVTKSKWHIPPFIEDIDKWLEEQRKGCLYIWLTQLLGGRSHA